MGTRTEDEINAKWRKHAQELKNVSVQEPKDEINAKHRIYSENQKDEINTKHRKCQQEFKDKR